MRIHRRDLDHVTILHLDGNFVGGPDSQRFADTIDTLVREGRLDTVLDLRHVKFINSAGIGILVRNYAHYVRPGGHMVVAGLSSRVAILFEMMLRNVFDTYDTEQEAVQALRHEVTHAGE